MKILKYLTWFGEGAIQPGTALYSLAHGIQAAFDELQDMTDYMTKQIYLTSASGSWLDLWGRDLAELSRKPGESDADYRDRIILTLFRVKVTRKAIIQAVEIVTGNKPVEVFEPIRDTAYWNACYFFSNRTAADVSAADDGCGAYVARLGGKSDTSYSGYVRVRLAADYIGGAGLSYFNAGCYSGRGFYLSGVSDSKRSITRGEVLDAVELIQPAGVEIKIEFIQ